jgi:hypothetical protein
MKCACAVLYCHVWPVCLYNTFLHYLIKGTILEGRGILSINSVLIFFYNFCLKRLILRRIQRGNLLSKMYIGFYVQSGYYCQILIELQISRQIWGGGGGILKYHIS